MKFKKEKIETNFGPIVVEKTINNQLFIHTKHRDGSAYIEIFKHVVDLKNQIYLTKVNTYSRKSLAGYNSIYQDYEIYPLLLNLVFGEKE